MSHFSHPCMHMAVRAYANEIVNETGQIFRRKFDFNICRKTTQPFLMCFTEIILG